MRRDGGENKNTIRMYILPRFTGIFFFFFFFVHLRCALDIVGRDTIRDSFDFDSAFDSHRRMENSNRRFLEGRETFFHVPRVHQVMYKRTKHDVKILGEEEIFLESTDAYSESAP